MPSLLIHAARVLLLVLLCSQGSEAQDLDPHQVFEAECLSCHGHAGAFARAKLHLDSDTPMTSGDRPVAAFLRYHRGGQPEPAIQSLVAMFRQQLLSGGLYSGLNQRCLFCHDRAYDFARQRLVLRDGKLVGRYSGHDIAAFLPGHARLTPSEAARMYATFESFLLPPR
ncbi:hypothetical protein ROG8370_03231 [Roseovarius gaetbuli]|uniref:Cytochrome c domain-containing protein n=1 Tax=Roseovarius gaetbuli TaxID=1356575 RepID=A0A1X7A2E3_9RHOB|nr:hypothetical protein [Roseovarius gaetbuli]SLN68681.1 hypothetical protein ROG8370_03231 [Roseovarius gaetbuli]